MVRQRLVGSVLILGISVGFGVSSTACGSALDVDALGAGAGAHDAQSGDEESDADLSADGDQGGHDAAASPTIKDGAASKDGFSSGLDGGTTVGSDGSTSGSDAEAWSDTGWNHGTVDDAGLWTGSGWTKMASSSNQVLRAVWGATSTSVWAGGENGTLLYFNGSVWSSRASSLTADGTVWALDGTANDDVYLLEYRSAGNGAMFLHHYDGNSWTEVTSFTGIGQVGCIHVPMRGLVYVYGAPKNSYTPSAPDALRLYRVNGATAAGKAFIGTTTFVSPIGYCSVHAFAPNDIWVSGSPVSRFDGANFVPVPGTPPTSDMVSVINAYQAFSRIHVWNGSIWQSQTTGLTGSLFRVTGRSIALAFGIVDNANGHVVRYASGGYTEETIPASTALLNDIWMAPSGRTFAVGFGGTILSGP